ncbi:hypothetical protein CYMTET_18604 [Cymbomonas tetramitiformis]|uniref:Uncharacterized protein n=1 Tax=Cymbomonas tetramitiformis TaxID=36881 RepID=A0AAE0G845_9CHLO|nr:hypothetical protein CYMTET_18604 [Cymbomonas tetramitiformis]
MAELEDAVILRKLQSLHIGGKSPKVSRFAVDIGWIPSKVTEECSTMAQKSAKIRQLADRLTTLGCMIDKRMRITYAPPHVGPRELAGGGASPVDGARGKRRAGGKPSRAKRRSSQPRVITGT